MTASTPRLSPADLAAALHDLPDVHQVGAEELIIRLQAPSFPDAVELIRRVGGTAEELNHHPDIDLRYRIVTFILSTHSAGGITQLDLDLAGRILAHGHDLSAEPLPPPDQVKTSIEE